MRQVLVLSLLLFAALARAESHDALVSRAFEALDDNFPEGWSFTETVENGEGISIARYDPARPEPEAWSLVSVDGRAPTEKETRQFLELKARRREAREAHDDETVVRIDDMVVEGSLKMREETDAYWEFEFDPVADSKEDAEFMRDVEGTLRVEKAGHYVSRIRLRNRKPIKPGKGVRIDAFATRLEFGPAHAGGPVLPLLVESAVQGKAMLMIRFDETERIRYSDFRPAGQ